MKTKRILSLFITLLLSMNLFLIPVSADGSADGPFIDNPHWNEVSSQTVTQLYNSESSFVVMFFRNDCSNSNLRKVIIDRWMTEYGLDVYGVAGGSIPRWAWNHLDAESRLPVICIVENGNVDCFPAEASMRSIQKRLQEYLGIYDESEVNFSRLNAETYQAYSTRSSTAMAQYCVPLSEIPEAIQAKTESIVSGAATQREKVKAIYDWVAANIYYNYGMLEGTHPIRVSAWETYNYKNSVCTGYANLTAAMCGAAGIPCRVVTGFATGVETESTVGGVWEIYETYLGDRDLAAFEESMGPYVNHAWNEAYVDGEWIILDTTWGSNNDHYPDTQGWITGTPTDAYFDPDLEWFSESHLFWEDYSSDLAVAVKNGKLTVSGALGAEDAASAKSAVLASFDSNGKMLECATLNLSGTSVSQTLANSGNAAGVKVFLVDGQYSPITAPYFGKAE